MVRAIQAEYGGARPLGIRTCSPQITVAAPEPGDPAAGQLNDAESDS